MDIQNEVDEELMRRFDEIEENHRQSMLSKYGQVEKLDSKDIGYENLLNGDTWHMIQNAEHLEAVRNNQSVQMINTWLGGIKNSGGAVFIPLQLLKELRHIGLIYCHLRNEDVITSDGMHYISIKNTVYQLGWLEDVDMCIVLYIVVAYVDADHDAGLTDAYENRVQVESGPMFTSKEPEPKDIVNKAMVAYAKQLTRASRLVNFLFALRRVTDAEELYSIIL